MRIFVPGDGDGEKKHDYRYTVFFTGAGYVSPLVPEKISFEDYYETEETENLRRLLNIKHEYEKWDYNFVTSHLFFFSDSI